MPPGNREPEMADFKADIVRVTIEPHPNADLIEVAKVGAFNSIVKKGEFATGELAAYIPEASVVPEDVIEELGLTGRLAGKRKNRVKAVKLRGVLSQGLLHPLDRGRLASAGPFAVGDEVTDLLGLVKYVPPVPMHMDGEVEPAPEGTLAFDVEPWKKTPEEITPEDFVIVTEKVHGTFCGISYAPESGYAVFSKGMGSRGLAFKLDVERNQRNLYVDAFNRHLSEGLAAYHAARGLGAGDRIFVLGEVYGRGVQDLQYGMTERGFLVFDVGVRPADGAVTWLRWEDVVTFCGETGLGHVPVLHAGTGWGPDMKLEEGLSAVGGGHMREGVVVRKEFAAGGRLLLKHVSEDYLLRRGGTEFD